MTKLQALTNACSTYRQASTPVQRMAMVYTIRRLITEDTLGTVLSIENELSNLEGEITYEDDKNYLRALGYQFPEDFDKPKEFMCND